MKQQRLSDKNDSQLPLSSRGVGRRKFLTSAAGIASMASVAAAVVSSCYKDKSKDSIVELGSGDIGVLNYAYALEQLEAAFYIRLVNDPYRGITEMERAMFSSIRDHEIAHREFFKKSLGSNAIDSVLVDFSTIDFGDRATVLATAKAFEDLGVSAYNGAGRLINSPDYLVMAGKIVSVEARHAAYIRDLISNGSFADSTVIDANGLDTSRTPAEVLAIAAPYLKTKIIASDLPLM
jgi:hypothetical protein